eukprot:CAMPEP_0114480980 /NCGR_PEP_ID=MMETSP0104-20121206/17421_1 /TAXON_ID=37642 ORGANISM="Paraphysomonas imperforata, Strain PA2" /NCGR_SAMPLE_ID=MMETSP0104 /ASSEMBLY_ACC=CAM_ASM_000202 /LENGTH=290 /DNA_ID=CAMNT_0001656501 /DNA_START=114 /DNA_END=987 /DNA_ORIENTATION=+
MKLLEASGKVYRIFSGVSLVVFVCIILLCSANWYVHIPSECGPEEVGDVTAFSYQPESTSKIYLKLFYGVCRKDSTAGTDHCMLWEDAEAWQFMDEINGGQLAGVKYLSMICLIISFVLLAFHCVVSCLGDVPWTVQVVAAATHLLLSFVLCLSLGLGLQTDTVKPQMFGNYFFGCNVHAEPGAAWWFGVLALVISVFAGVILLFPYLGGPTWVLKWARCVEVVPSEDDDYERHRDELELRDADDPFADIHLEDEWEYDDDEGVDDGDDDEWEYEDEEAAVQGGGGKKRN